MKAFRAVVRGGQLVVEGKVSLPEGTELELTVSDPGDELDDDERAALHAALEEAWESARRGQLIPAERLAKELRELK